MSKEDLARELRLRDKFSAERTLSNKLYANKLTQKIVYSMLAAALIAVLGAILNLVVNKPAALP